MTNVMNWIDAYKFDHRRQYPDGTTEILSNFTPRTSRIEGIDSVVFFGLQAFLVDFMEAFEEFFARDVDDVCAEYEQNLLEVIGPNDIGTDHIRALHNLGYVPLEFKAVPEGFQVPLRVPMFTVRNTHEDFFWLVNYFESAVSASVWLPCTTATQALRMRKMLAGWYDKTVGNTDTLDFMVHDFSFRGMASRDAAGASGAGHMLSFSGSDSIIAKDWIRKYYGPASEPLALSVPATEHSVMCAGGAGKDEEFETYNRLLDIYPSGLLSVVSDTWDLWAVLTDYLPRLKDKIMARDGKLVIRPDSGDPVDILCGTWRDISGFNTLLDLGSQNSAETPEEKGVIEILWDIFGGTINDQGYKELDSHIGAIYGDSITFDRAGDICRRLEAKGFASSNVVMGVGSYSYQYVTRDTFGFAMKATNAVVNGEDRPIFKDPVTDNGTKKSARGRLAVIHGDTGKLVLLDELEREELDELTDENMLETVWINGHFIRKHTFDEVRGRVRLIV